MIEAAAIVVLVLLAVQTYAAAPTVRWLPLALVAGLAGTVAAHHVLAPRFGARVDAESTRLVMHSLPGLRAALADPGTELLVVVNGASVTARGVDGSLLQTRLRHRTGLAVAVVQVSLAGANHIERQAIARSLVDGLSSAERARLAAIPMVVLWEVHRGYDTELLAQFSENRGTARAFAYLDAAGAWRWLRAASAANRPLLRKQARELAPEVAWHAGMSTFRLGSWHWFAPSGGIRPLAGFNPEERLRERARVVGLPMNIERMRAVRSAGAPVYLDRNLVPGYLDAFRNPRAEVVFFSPPSRHVGHMAYVQQVCRDHAGKVCIGFRNRALLARLDHRRFWVDGSHLAPEGANIYTRWLSDVLADAVIRHDMARQRDPFG